MLLASVRRGSVIRENAVNDRLRALRAFNEILHGIMAGRALLGLIIAYEGEGATQPNGFFLGVWRQ
jgi:hypothetical protein